ncbi:antitoxin [Acaricomes phytoseiuli]|uniref:antitoxin n=1 Tax=Acaricomes phytoseiuli TaxID=291968 RepID=UPI00036B8993|nr:antitoxin [Acaricomes phytoseiuli]MCW1249058.1 antitoxin [Acaricomes phytoseiuli]
MGLFDDIKGKAEQLIGGNRDAIKDGIGKAGDFIDSKTGDRFKDQIDSVQSSVGGFVDKVGGDEGQSAEAVAEAEGVPTTEQPATGAPDAENAAPEAGDFEEPHQG